VSQLSWVRARNILWLGTRTII